MHSANNYLSIPVLVVQSFDRQSGTDVLILSPCNNSGKSRQYGLIPPENRLLWVDMVEILWVTILSKQAAQEAKDKDSAPNDTEAA
jgi:Mpv17 / PMP22 family